MVLDQDKAKELMSLGFTYTYDCVDDKTAYAFFVCDDLLKYINSHFSTTDFFLSSTLRF